MKQVSFVPVSFVGLLFAVYVGYGCSQDKTTETSSSGPVDVPSTIPTFSTPIIAELSGSEGYDWFGLSLTMAGDINGDGAADLVASSLSASRGGLVGVFLGPLHGQRMVTEADALVAGEFQFNNAGQSLAEAGHCDIDGDGLADLLIGSPFADRFEIAVQATLSGDNNGRAFIVFGASNVAESWAAPKRRNTGQADVAFVGAAKYDTAGFTVACVGDLDNDGRSEIAIAAPRSAAGMAKGAGAVHLIYGRPREQFSLVVNLEDSDAIFRGESAYDAAGTAMAATGDITGDGLPDLTIGAPGRKESGNDSGAVYVLAGSSMRFSGEIALSSATAVLLGEFEGQRIGTSLTSAGDMNGDGILDLLVGSSSVGAALSKPGRGYVVPGGKSLVGRTKVNASSLILVGEKNGDTAGLGIASLGDLNGDGRSEIAMGAPSGDGAVPNAGRVYVVAGRSFTVPATVNLGAEVIIARGATAIDHLGEVLAGGEDLDGDGVSDVVISARGRSTKISAAGSVYVVSGKGLLP